MPASIVPVALEPAAPTLLRFGVFEAGCAGSVRDCAGPEWTVGMPDIEESSDELGHVIRHPSQPPGSQHPRANRSTRIAIRQVLQSS